MSLKINVIYKGIIYRVKGIKVLCSVVWTVIILLVAIVGMGVWMIINVYDDGKSLSLIDDSPNVNLLNETDKIELEAPSIDFGTEEAENSKVSLFDMKIRNVEFKEITEKPQISKPKSTPEPEYEYVYEYHEPDVYDPSPKEPVIVSSDETMEETFSQNINPEDVPPFLLTRSDELFPVERTRPDEIIPSESINFEKIKPSERINLDEIKSSERINFEGIKPSERITFDEIKPSERINFDEIKPSERLRPNNKHSERVNLDKIIPTFKEEINLLGRTNLDKSKPLGTDHSKERNPFENVRFEINPSERITEEILKSGNNPVLKKQEDIKLIPIKLIPKDTKAPMFNKPLESSNRQDDYAPFYDLSYPNLSKVNRDKIDQEIWKPTKEARPTLIRNPTRLPVTITNQFFKRSGIPASESLTYRGPPVVGYGLNPYEKLTRDRIKEYDQFWQTYTGKKNDFKFKFNDTLKTFMRPHLRGLRPTGSEYDLPVRPDAQSPPKVHSQKEVNMHMPLRPPRTNSNRKLLIRTSPTIKPNLPIMNPLQELYDYSKKLAASLLSFNSKSTEQLQNSSEKLAEYGINLLESHNNIFKQPPGGPFNRIFSLIPSPERLRSMDPFELSLITWTFLDFWEFLIEKVGTLSDEDLILLQERLENLRRRKDDAMTRVFVNETLIRYTSGNQRSIERYETINGTNEQEIVNYEEDKNKEENIHSSSEQKLTSSITPGSNGLILAGLFPTIAGLSKNIDKEVTNTGNETIKTMSNEVLKGTRNETFDLGIDQISRLDKIDLSLETKLDDKNIHVQNLSNKNLKNDTELNEAINEKEDLLNISKNLYPPIETFINENNTSQRNKTLTNAANINVPNEQSSLFKKTIQKLMSFLAPKRNDTMTNSSQLNVEGRSSAWDPLGFFTSESRMKFMQFAVKVVFNFGKVYVKKPYALDCSMLLFCKDLNQAANKGGVESMAAKLKSVGLKVLTESEQELREADTFGDVWRSVTSWTPLQCDAMFPRCDGPKALEIVNEVALGSN